MKLALSLLCENPVRKTGLTSLFVEFVGRSLEQFQDLEWVVYVGEAHDWSVEHERLVIVRDFAGNDRVKERLLADHFKVGPDASKRAVDALVTIGFVPVRTGGLPVVMHMLSLQHLSSDNKIGFMRGIYRKWAVARGLAKADLIITNTEFAISQILEVNPEVKPKIIQSYEGLQHEFYVPDEESDEVVRLKGKFGIEPGYLYWCSNFYPYKQAEEFFDAYALLSTEEQDALPIVMVGGTGWGDGFEKAMTHAATLGIEKRVTKLGWVDDEDLAMLYRQSRFFVLASREETFGRCVIESMACGRPCVVNDIPVMHEVTGGNALIVDFDDSQASAKSMKRFLHDPALYSDISKKGMEWVSKFDFDKLSKERIIAIQELLKSKYL